MHAYICACEWAQPQPLQPLCNSVRRKMQILIEKQQQRSMKAAEEGGEKKKKASVSVPRACMCTLAQWPAKHLEQSQKNAE